MVHSALPRLAAAPALASQGPAAHRWRSASRWTLLLAISSLFLAAAQPAHALVEVDYFPSTSALMELKTPTGGSQAIALSGPTTVHVFFEGAKEGEARDNNGNGLDEVETEMVDLQLTGNSSFGPVQVTLNPSMPSRGQIEETANTQSGRLDLPPFAPSGTANSFFDLFFKVQVGPFTFFTTQPKRMSSVITHKPPGPGNTYESVELIPLLDANGRPTGFSIGAGRHVPQPVVEVDYFPSTSALMELNTPTGGSQAIALSGPTTVHVFFEGANEGDASDNSGNGLDEVQTEMVDLQLTGNSSFGPVQVTLNPSLPSRGQIEETANTQPGRLDLPPFAPAGTASSFFDLFFQVQVGPFTFFTAQPKRMSSVITHKPPAPGNTYENPEQIPLLDANGRPTGFSIGAGRHVPQPVVEVDYFPSTSALMELAMPGGGSEAIALSGPTTVHVFFEGANEGDASDNSGNGLDEVQTEMVDLQLTGNSSFGPVQVTLNPSMPSRGQIEETANTQPGRLDLPPFAPSGTANSFFDLFFKVQVGPFTFFTAQPKRMSSVITHKPPGPGDTYENPEQIPLLDANGNPTGFFIGAGRHVPQPVPDPECPLELLQCNADLRICRASLTKATTDLSTTQGQLAATEAALTTALGERDAAAAERDRALGTVADLQKQVGQLQALLDTCEGHPPNLACQADLSSDGIVNFKDLALFKSVFFKKCEPTP